MAKAARFRFTKAALSGIQVPNGAKYVDVFDEEIKELGCRTWATGTMTMFVYKKVKGVPVRKTLGRYIPGPGGNSVEGFRKDARVELGKIADDPTTWLHGEEKQVVDNITITDAFDKALGVAKRGDLAKRDWNVAKERFMDWLKETHPRLKLWVDLRRQHIREYKDARASVSANRQRLDLQPVLQVAHYMANHFEIPDVAAGIKLSNKLKNPTEAIYLQDVLGFLDWLKERGEAALEAGVALGALTGLRLFEVLALRWSKVDLERGLIETGTKNDYSHRVIPLAARVIEALKRVEALPRPTRAIQDPDGGAVVATPVEFVAYDKGKDSWHNYSKLVRKAVADYCEHLNKERAKAGNKTKISLKWQVKNFRNVLPTLATIRGFESATMEQYLGHSAKGVTARHYVPRLAAGSLGEAAELDRAMESFRRLVVEPLEAEIALTRYKPQPQLH